ncbi:MAG: hypothetical protein Q4A60_01755 [Pasteurellaceae bacterium]|nr:hypothetical protein [Pasteurellaceae bacterium]
MELEMEILLHYFFLFFYLPTEWSSELLYFFSEEYDNQMLKLDYTHSQFIFGWLLGSMIFFMIINLSYLDSKKIKPYAPFLQMSPFVTIPLLIYIFRDVKDFLPW